MSRIMLDTSAYSAFKRGHEQVVTTLRQASEILLPMVMLGELLAGFEHGGRNEANRRELDRFLRSPRVVVVPVIQTTAERYALIYAGLRRTGTPLPSNNIWISAAAMEHGTRLITLDSHYTQVPQIVVACFQP